MRAPLEIFNILLEEVKQSGDFFGMCTLTKQLAYKDILTGDEAIFIRNMLRDEYPTIDRNRQFLNSRSFLPIISDSEDVGAYLWWSLDSEGKKQRILFLKHIISKLDEKPKTSFTGSNLISAIRSFVNRLRARS